MTLQPEPQKKGRRYPRRKQPSEVIILCKHCNGGNCIKKGFTTSNQRQNYWCKDCERAFIEPIPPNLFDINPEDEYQKDVWDCRRLGISPSVGKQAYTIKFTKISQPWLRQAGKAFIKLSLSTLGFSSALNKVGAVNKFSVFLAKRHPSIEPAQVSREIIIDFLAYLAGQKIAATTRSHLIGDLRDFLELCYHNDWLPVTRYLIRREDFPKRPKAIPRYIPEVVMQQLNQHLDDLPEPVMRMVLIIQECGMRISELLYLKPDCLLQDRAGDWFLRYYQFKLKKELTVPVSKEVVRVIQEQRQYIQEHLNEPYEYLFCTTYCGTGFRLRAKLMSRITFAKYLNKLAKQHGICDESGKLWHFQTHQFRHTVGTRMINNGVPQHIIQRYLGHESPEMTATYAQIHDQTMKEEIAKFRGKVVNISGQVVEPNDIEADDHELQWVKKNIQAQALPNGSCALPAISKGCPHANACLTCTHFRTTPEHLPTHKQEREETLKIIDKAKAGGWQRMVEMNEKKLVSLDNIIESLEEGGEDGCQT
ncbi:MAG: tyrosine-type recombinase/integrase [Nodosilinea sp. WJT8-NPBG4]|jgi:integrase|nr:tyrosine-type recombinase/integrase [Nodosilinea sp. WJT8-NPBG4]